MNNLPKRRRNPKRVCNQKTNVGQIFALSVGSFSLFHRADCVQSRRVYGNNSIHDYIVSQQTAKIESCHAHTVFSSRLHATTTTATTLMKSSLSTST